LIGLKLIKIAGGIDTFADRRKLLDYEQGDGRGREGV